MHRRRFLRSGAALGVGAVGVGAAGVSLGEFGAGSLATRSESNAAAVAGTGDSRDEPYAPIGRLPLDDAFEAVVSEDGGTAFVATGDGYVTVDLSDPADPTVLANRSDLLADHDRGPLERIWDLKVDGDDLLVVGPAHRHSSVDAAIHVDVSDPANPEQVGVVETAFPIHNCDVADGVAYLTGNDRRSNPLVSVDLATGAELARWSVVQADEAWEAVDQSLRVIHDVAVRDGVAYLAYWDAGTYLLDVADPADPTLLGSVTPHEPADLADLSETEVRREQTALPGNHHYAAPNETGDLLAINAEAWAVEGGGGGDGGGGGGDGGGGGGNGDGGGDGGGGDDDGDDGDGNGDEGGLRGEPGGIDLYDISDPATPTHLASIAAPGSPDPTSSGVWTTSHNFELRGDRLYTSWYEGGVKIHDVSDPANPTAIAGWRDPANASFWTAQVAVPGEFVVASSTGYRPTDAGLYTFPDRAGEQADPPPLEDALDADRSTETADGPSTGTPNGTSTETAGGTPTGTPNGASTATEGPDSDWPGAGTTDGSAPGFGPGVGAVGVGAACAAATAWALRRRNRGNREE